MTHDLVTEMLSQLEAKVVRIAVTELRENTFYALITVVVNGSELEIDSRPSDAIALAVCERTPRSSPRTRSSRKVRSSSSKART